jgi:hypothetical protein
LNAICRCQISEHGIFLFAKIRGHSLMVGKRSGIFLYRNHRVTIRVPNGHDSLRPVALSITLVAERRAFYQSVVGGKTLSAGFHVVG